MQRRAVIVMGSVAVGVLAIFGVIANTRVQARPAAANTTSAEAAQAPPVPVIVELFTSEGCSSCPPADEVLTKIEGKRAGADVIVMGEHVTYWDRLGWKDRFSQDVFTERQEDYGRRFRLGSVYTPQAVVNGDAEVLGSDERGVRKVVANATKEPRAKVELTIGAGDVVNYRVTGLPLGARGAEVFLAVTESRLDTSVRAGENGGRTLRHTGVVRSLQTVGRVQEIKSEGFAGSATARVDKAWKRDNVKLVVFVQDRASLKIWGASAVGL